MTSDFSSSQKNYIIFKFKIFTKEFQKYQDHKNNLNQTTLVLFKISEKEDLENFWV